MIELDGTKSWKIENTKSKEERVITRDLKFKLNEEDFAEKGRKAGRIAIELSKTNAEFERVKKEWKGKIENLDGELQGILDTIHRGEEQRHVKCIEQKDFDKNIVSYIFNGEVMHERPLEINERQMKLVKNNNKEKEDFKKAAAGDRDERQEIAEVIEEEKKGLR